MNTTWYEAVAWPLVGLYGAALLFIFGYSLVQTHLVWLYRRRPVEKLFDLPTEWPRVTVQLPIYNERYVVTRLLDAVAAFDYPADRLQIQVLDDSTDETTGLIADRVAHWVAQGVRMEHVRRPRRTGFKAGALAYGLTRAEGELIAIFDADFLPAPDFLRRTVPAFTDARTGVVQTRWEHLNANYSLLTELQAFGLDAHFSVEQAGRAAGYHFINFNGTAGVWRKACIEDAGGWQSDTLTEDLDLSYRAQLRGWQFRYLEAVGTPAELPVALSALRNQQYRWTKGAAECARKNLGAVLRARTLPLATRLHALFHLLNSAVFVCVLVSALLSVPLLLVKAHVPALRPLFVGASFFLLSLVALVAFYWTSYRQTTTETKPSGSPPRQPSAWTFARRFPLFLSVSMGLSLHNAVAVLEGYAGRRTPFVRTPKFNVRTREDRWEQNAYLRPRLSGLVLAEALLALYFGGGIALALWLGDYGLLPFHLMLMFGYGFVVGCSWQQRRGARA